MKLTGMFYATREGQTRRIAQHIAAALRARGVPTDLRNLADPGEPSLADYDAVVLAASVHVGRHEPEMSKFIKRHRDELDELPTAFLSVNLSEAGVERPTATPEERARFAADVQHVLDNFFESVQWRPKRMKPVAGALLYTKYNFLVRFIMKRIARKTGAETDTSRDYEYTDWAALDQFVDEFCKELPVNSVSAERAGVLPKS
jgi:menaquinone-dependent protoporphyrinogen oxidase